MGKWIRELSPADKEYGDDWCGRMDRCYRQDRKYIVMTRQIQTDWGVIEHACIRNRDNTDISWAEKQRIKNELFGEKAVAIEIFPSKERLVDSVNMYHLWVLPEGMELPFGLHKLDKQGEHIKRTLMLKKALTSERK